MTENNEKILAWDRQSNVAGLILLMGSHLCNNKFIFML